MALMVLFLNRQVISRRIFPGSFHRVWDNNGAEVAEEKVRNSFSSFELIDVSSFFMHIDDSLLRHWCAEYSGMLQAGEATLGVVSDAGGRWHEFHALDQAKSPAG
jgi:hypothetical protein